MCFKIWNEIKFIDYFLNWLYVIVFIERKEFNFGNKKYYLILLLEWLFCVFVIFIDDLV